MQWGLAHRLQTRKRNNGIMWPDQGGTPYRGENATHELTLVPGQLQARVPAVPGFPTANYAESGREAMTPRIGFRCCRLPSRAVRPCRKARQEIHTGQAAAREGHPSTTFTTTHALGSTRLAPGSARNVGNGGQREAPVNWLPVPIPTSSLCSHIPHQLTAAGGHADAGRHFTIANGGGLGKLPCPFRRWPQGQASQHPEVA
uniref:Uncharacterized protein n=1 Tax=Sphaerodactylus townsendi TaxID=933632 RepID=A0ACB8EHP0_9SAUR